MTFQNADENAGADPWQDGGHAKGVLPERIPAKPYALTAEDVRGALDSDSTRGLTAEAVAARRESFGANELRAARRRSTWTILVDQSRSVVLIVLLIAGIAAFAFSHVAEGIAISAVFLVNGLIGFMSEWKAVRSVEALRDLGAQHARVRRDGAERDLPQEELVPGDLILLEQGNLIAADARLLETEELRVNEAALTGESVPVIKTTDPVDAEAPLAERACMLFRETTVVEGRGTAVVTATGMDTEIGRISRLTEEAEGEGTPLQRRLDRLGRRMAVGVGIIAVAISGIGLLTGRDAVVVVKTAIALGLAAIPEGLPIVATIALARGMWLMARRHVLINRLTAVETLGATHVVFTDKTGTLTENHMTVRRIVTPVDDQDPGTGGPNGDGQEGGSRWIQRVIELGVLCNNATLTEQEDVKEEAQGDPLEVCLLEAGAARNMHREDLLNRKPEVREVSFDPDVMMMATFHEVSDGYEVAVKGAPSAVLDVCRRAVGRDADRPLDERQRQDWHQRVKGLAAEGMRLLAMADKTVSRHDAEPYEDLRFVGVVCMADPPRAEVREAIRRCQVAGIRIVMVTGDQPETAAAIGRRVGLRRDDEELPVIHGRDIGKPEELSDQPRQHLLRAGVFARVSPEQKLDLISLYQEKGETVAMTGDGVNDAPALKKADIGIAMGRRGTDAARQVADMVLTDDAFGSIVAAVEQGRIIFGNIRKSVMFMLCTNGAEILAVTAATLAGLPIPLRPLQILFLNVLTDVLPALALGVGKGTPDVMRRPPRPASESVLTREHWLSIGGWSVVISVCVLAGLAVSLEWLGLSEPEAVTVSFLTLAFAKLFFVFNLRDRHSRLWDNDVVRNPWVWVSLGICALLLIAAVYMPGLSDVLSTRPVGVAPWMVALGLSLMPMVLGQVMHRVGSRSEGANGGD